MLKTAGVLGLCLLVLISLAGCGLREKVAEKVTEGLLEKAADGQVDIDIDGDEITIGGADGEIVIGGNEWPSGKAADMLPRFKKGSITAVFNSDKGCMITVEEVEEEDFTKYVEDLKGAGFVDNPTDFSSNDDIIYSAQSSEKASVTAVYSRKDLVMQLSIEILE